MGKPWFAPKRYGYGTSLPIAWQGWVVFIGFFVVLAILVEGSLSLLPAALATTVIMFGSLALLAVFVAIARAKTAGGWRWRWGEGP